MKYSEMFKAFVSGDLPKLQTTVTELEAKCAELEAKVSTHATEYATLKKQFDDGVITISGLNKDLITAKAAVTDFEAKVDAAAGIKAQAIIGKSGHAPVKDNPDGKTESVMTRINFFKLSPAMQMSFVKAGGTLVE